MLAPGETCLRRNVSAGRLLLRLLCAKRLGGFMFCLTSYPSVSTNSGREFVAAPGGVLR